MVVMHGRAPGDVGHRHGARLAPSALLLAVLALPACVPYQAAPLDPPASASHFATRRLDDAQLMEAVRKRLPQVPPETLGAPWDRGQLLAVALTLNPDLAVARAQAQAVRAREVAAALWPNPDLLLESEYAIHDTHPWLYGVEVDWPLRSPERRTLKIASARLESEGARFELLDAAWSVRRALIEALSATESSRRRLQLIEELARAQSDMLTAERRRIEAGEDPPAELVTAQRALIEVEQRRLEEREHLAQAHAALSRALGLPPEALEGIEIRWSEWGEPPPLTDLAARRERALLSRADLLALINDYARTEAELHLAVARQYPELVLEPGYYWDHGIAKFPFNVGFTLPVDRNRGEIAQARAARDLAGERMLALQARIYGEIAASEHAEGIARENVAAAQRQLEAAHHQLQQAELGVRLGAIDSLERAGAQLLALRAELELLDLRSELQAARNALEDGLRAPLSGPELVLAPAVSAGANPS
jgi:outer membrane protein TolC